MTAAAEQPAVSIAGQELIGFRRPPAAGFVHAERRSTGLVHPGDNRIDQPPGNFGAIAAGEQGGVTAMKVEQSRDELAPGKIAGGARVPSRSKIMARIITFLPSGWLSGSKNQATSVN